MSVASLLQGGGSQGIQLTGSQPQASPSSGLTVQPASPTATVYLQPTTAPSNGQTLTSPSGGGSINPGATGSGGGGSATPSGPTAAQLAAQANYDQLHTTDMNAIQNNIGANALGYNQGILDYFNGAGGVNSQQNSINAAAVQNELSRDSGMQGVRDMVNNGIQGGGVVLDNDNAGTSSAADALARAYGVVGRQQASGVGRQYAQGQNTIANNQKNLDTAVNNFTTVDAPAKKAAAINDVVQSATQALTYLNLVAGQTADPTQIGSIVDQINQIKAQATDALTAYDGQLASQTAANAPTSQTANQAKAQQLFTSGTAPANAFNFTSTAPATLQNTGPAASSLPIYIAPSNKSTVPATV